jgi:BirA family biotin operon repressor/biotin-[acetyl-CoA-carboxylase] ligase
MHRRRIGGRIERHASIGSTNDRARELLADPDADGTVVVAEEQTAGRGRRGRGWLSPAGRNLYLSVAFVPAIGAADAWRIGLATALAVADACATVAPVGLKWPNDVVAAADGRKLGGLLIETIAEGDRLRGAVLGIGINVNWRRAEMPAELRDDATSLADLAGADINRDTLLSRLVGALAAEIDAIEAGASPLERYRARCTTLGSSVSVETGSDVVTGTAIDLAETGALVVEDALGRRHVLSGGEVRRVRPMVPA